jgi:membrane-anchored glycerophosphoryl diester phosphodiesterase (GDPDase)
MLTRERVIYCTVYCTVLYCTVRYSIIIYSIDRGTREVYLGIICCTDNLTCTPSLYSTQYILQYLPISIFELSMNIFENVLVYIPNFLQHH